MVSVDRVETDDDGHRKNAKQLVGDGPPREFGEILDAVIRVGQHLGNKCYQPCYLQIFNFFLIFLG